MDDFDFDENEEQNIEQDNTSAVDAAIDAKNRAREIQDKYQSAKDNIEKAKKFKDGVREGATEKAKKGATDTAAKGATKTAAKEGTKTAAKGATKTAAKEGTKTAAKEATKLAAKEGAKAGAKGALAASGAVTAGAGTAAAAAIEAADRLNKARKKASDKIDNVIMQTTGLNLKGKKKFIIILAIFLFYFVIINTSFMFLASEQTYDDLYAIIKKRQVRYAESGKTFKSILLMTNAEINEILTRDYLESGQKVSDSKYSEYDLCYRTYLASIYNEEYDNFIPSDSNDPNSTYAEKIKIIEKYLKASRSNFNKIKWLLNGGTGGVEIKQYDLKDNLVGVSISGAAAALLNASNNYLSMPNLDKYKSSPSSTADEMKSMYISMVEKYLQPWVVPYALNVASQNNDFGKSVLDDMYDPITVTLYELDRLTRTTITYYYLETTVQVDHYTEDRHCEPDGNGGEDCSSTWVYSNTTYQDSTTATTWTDSDSERYSVSLKTDGGGYIRAGIKSGPTVDRDQKPYRHVPKLTSAEAFYEVLIAKYAIKPINEANPPVETSTTLDADGKETIIDLFDETLTSVSTESKPYKVSYIGDENETYPRKSKSRKEEIKKKYVGSATEDPKIQGYSYDQLSFGYTQIEKYYNMAASGGVIGSSSGTLTNIPAGGFAWPVPAILTSGVTIDSEISSPFGQRIHPITGVPSFHPAIDIVHGGLGNPGSTKGVSYGPDIVAAQSGTAYIKHNPGGYGDNYVVIDHKNGFCTLYGHLFSVSITDGQEVTQGQTIGVMGTEGSSTGVHLHFGIYQSDSVDSLSNDKAIDPKSVYNSDGTAVGGVTNTGTNAVTATSNQPVMDQMCAKAIDLAENTRNIIYTSPPANCDIDTIEELTTPDWRTDCSGFVSAMYKAYLGINVGEWTDPMNEKGQSGYSENGWTAEYHDWSGDVSELLPGDMLLRSSNHVGLYVGNGKQVDNGSGVGPNHKDATVSNYDHYIRYTNPNVVSTTATTNTPGSSSTSNSAAKKISRVEWYLDFQPAKNDTGGSGASGGSTGTPFAWTVADIDNVAAQIENGSGSWDLLSFLVLSEGGVYSRDCSADGTQYKVENDGRGYPTVGPGICIMYNIERLQNHGVSDPSSLSYTTPDYVDKEVVIAVVNEEMGAFADLVDKKLADNGITVENHQRDALILHAYMMGNIDGFPSAYRAANGDPEATSKYFLGSDTDGVGKRKRAEAELYSTGTYPESIYD